MVGSTWYDAESNAESKADEAIAIAEEARDIANDAKDVADDALEQAQFAIKPTDLDNVTIKKGLSNKYEAQGTINHNIAVNGVVYDWVGTEAQYYEQDVGGNHPDWVCFITDDAKDIATLYITVDYNSPNERLVITSGGSGTGTKITQANYSSTYLRLILS